MTLVRKSFHKSFSVFHLGTYVRPKLACMVENQKLNPCAVYKNSKIPLPYHGSFLIA